MPTVSSLLPAPSRMTVAMASKQANHWRWLRWPWALLVITAVGWMMQAELGRIGGALTCLIGERLAAMQQPERASQLFVWAERLGLAPICVILPSQREPLPPTAFLSLPDTANQARLTAAMANHLAVQASFQHQPISDTLGLLHQAQENAPQEAAVRYNLGYILQQANQPDAAAQRWQEASQLAPDWALPLVQLSALYLAEGAYERAEQAARQALQRDPQMRTAHIALIEALYHQPNSANLREIALIDALKLFENDRILLFHKALVWKELGKDEEALALLHRLSAFGPDPTLHTRVAQEIADLLARRSLLPETPLSPTRVPTRDPS